STLERDGVAFFESGLFVERGLAEAPVSRLLDRAFQLQYLTQPDAAPQRLHGMHALLGIAEPSMIAVPDAVHQPPIPRLPLQGWLAAPRHLRVQVTGDDTAVLDWDGPRSATSFRIERALDPQF